MGEGHGAVAVSAPHELTAGSSWLLRYERSYPGRRDQVRAVRSFLREVLAPWPRANDAVLVASEFAANACMHSRSGAPGGLFTVRAEVSEGNYLHVAVGDEGGSWEPRGCAVAPLHGLDLIQAIAGPANWGVSGDQAGRLVWARLCWPGAVLADAQLPGPPAAAGGPHDEDAVTDLARLAPSLHARGLAAELVIPDGRMPHLAVHPLDAPMLAKKVYATADWFFWPTAERIASCGDLAGAATEIARVLSPQSGGPHA